MDSSKKRITLSFSVPSGAKCDRAAASNSPLTQTHSDATGSNQKENMRPSEAKRTKTFMDNWIEPPLPPPAPSFSDYPHLRIERHGVLEGMAPLGTLPSAKVKKLVKTKQDALSKALVNTEESDASTSAGTPREMRTPEAPTNTIVRRSYSREEDNADWTPQPSAADLRWPAAMRKGATMSASKTFRVPGQRVEPHPDSPSTAKEVRALELTAKAVELAVEEAILAQRWPTAYALRTLYNDYAENSRIRRLFMLIYTNRATKEERREFQTLITWKKKTGSQNNRAQKYFDTHENVYIDKNPSALATSVESTKDKAEATPRGASTSTPTSPHKQDTTHAHKKPKVSHDDQFRRRKSLSSNAEININEASATNNNKSQSQRHQDGNHGTKSARSGYDSDATMDVNMAQASARPRGDSLSSTSSLSSLDEEILGGFESPVKKPADFRLNEAPKDKVSERKAANSAEQPGHDHKQPQPITQRQDHVHNRNDFTAVNSRSSSNTATTHVPDSSSTNNQHNGNNVMQPLAADRYSLPPPNPSNLTQPPPFNAKKKTAASAAAAAARKAGSFSPRDAEIIRRKKQVKSKAEKEYQAQRDSSFVRTPVSVPESEDEDEALTTTIVAPQPAVIKPILRFRPRPAGDDSDVQSSPTRLTFKLDFEPESAKGSRASTPTGSSRASRKARNPGPRMKSSPQKKPARASSAFGRSDHDSLFSPSTGEHGGQDDNDDFCSSCGGSGDLVCCDGCTRSFHLRCVDPPMDQKDLPDEWFCNVCVAQRKGVTAHTGLFGKLVTLLEKKNPHAFYLPKEIREYFDGVRTGPEGEYEDHASLPRKGKHEEQDLYRLYDRKGQPVLCHVCSEGSGGKKPIITCSYCNLSWHLDCLDPPLANPPGNGPTRPWKCPCHVDDLLAVPNKRLGPAHKFRRIKGKPAIRPEFTRGVRNQGHIEVELDPTDNERDTDFVEEREFGRVYKLPQQGIILDFIDRVHGKRHREGRDAETQPQIIVQPYPTLAMAEYSLQDQQAALNLAALLGSDSSSQDNMRSLTNAMVAGLSGTGAVEIIAKGSVAKLVQDPTQANGADDLTLDLLIQMGKEAEAMKAERLPKWVGQQRQRRGSEPPTAVERDANWNEHRNTPSAAWADARVAKSESPTPMTEEEERSQIAHVPVAYEKKKKRKNLAENATAKVDRDGDVDMDTNGVPVVPVATSCTSSSALQGEKRKLGDKDGLLHAEHRERTKRSKSR